MGRKTKAVVGVCKCGESDPSKFSASRVGKKGGPCKACMSAYNLAHRTAKLGRAPRHNPLGVIGVCSKCGATDPKEFTPSAFASSGGWCRKCFSAYRRRKDASGMSVAQASQTRRRARTIEWLRNVKSERGCVRCGEKHPACLDFHHRDEAAKLFGIGTRVHFFGREKLLAEIAKTDVLCSNCHRKMHWDEKSGGFSTTQWKKKPRPGISPSD